jgi:glycerol uptake facilitator-like aquaporin
VIITASLTSLTPFDSLFLIALAFGGVVGVVILLIGEICGAIINPALTLAAVAARSVKSGLLLPYVIFQLAGGIFAGITLRVIFPAVGSTDLGSTKLAFGIDPLSGIIIEAIGTFVLASAALVAGKKFLRHWQQAIVVGGTLFLLILLIGPLTGASFNPARTIGPALASNYLNDVYVYMIGPCLGALIAGIMFRWVNNHIETKNTVCMRP